MNAKCFFNKLCKRLLLEGFHVLYYFSYSTSSIYIKLDYGVAHSVTIRDHKGKKKYDYRFNVMMKGLDESYTDNNNHRFYFTPKDFELLINSILENREMVKAKYGSRYNDYMRSGKNKIGVAKGFWQQCKEYKEGD